jgi:hypothetical protein
MPAPRLKLRRRDLLDAVALAQVFLGQHVHLGDMPRGHIADRSPQLAYPLTREPIDDPMAVAARTGQTGFRE